MLNVDRDLVQQARLQSQADRKLIDELVEIRKRKEKSEGLTQTVVALRMGTKQANVSRLESGEVDVRRRTLRNYALAIGVRIEYTIKDLDATPTESPAKASA